MVVITRPSIEVVVGRAARPIPVSRSAPLVLWHLLSLDATTVATLWTWFLAASNHIRLPAVAVLAMTLAVWVLYAADRLLDTRTDSSVAESRLKDLRERHRFHRSNGRRFAVGIVCASIALAVLLPRLPQPSIRLYGILGSMLFAYFVLIHGPESTFRLPKEFAVGAFFSAATFIPTVSRKPGLRLDLLPAALLFAVLCSSNCLFIHAWEHPDGSSLADPATRFAVRFVPLISILAAVCGVALLLAPHLPWQIPAACALSAALLLLLHRNRDRVAPTSLRASADLCLLTPLLFLFSVR